MNKLPTHKFKSGETNEFSETCAVCLEDFQENHRGFSSKGNKAAGGRARKAIGEIKKLVTEF